MKRVGGSNDTIKQVVALEDPLIFWKVQVSIQGRAFFRSEKNSLNIKFLGGIFLGHPGPRRRDIPDRIVS